MSTTDINAATLVASKNEKDYQAFDRARKHAYDTNDPIEFFKRIRDVQKEFGFLTADDHAARALAHYDAEKMAPHNELVGKLTTMDEDTHTLEVIVEGQEANVELAPPLKMHITRPATPEDRVDALNSGAPVPAGAYTL